MRRSLQIVTSGLLTALLAIAINVATGGRLPDPFDEFAGLAWPLVGLLAVTLAALSAWQPPGPPAEARVPAQLPPTRPVRGRDTELAAIGRSGTVLITGVPGAGKTALALHAAHRLRRRYPGGQLYAELRGTTTPDTVLLGFLRALGAPDSAAGLDELAARFRTAVASRRMLIVLDNAQEDDQITPLLPGGTGTLVLITSRRQLTAGRTIRLGPLDAGAARAVLADTAGADRIAADPAGADRVVAACAGLPLAVRLAAARLRDRPGWTAGDLADRLTDDRRRLDELTHGDAAVRATFRDAYEALSSTDRLVFRRVGAHPGPIFGTAAAAALSELDEGTVSGALDRLTDAMLAESPAPGRYRLHDLLRLYARELADDDTALDRLLTWLTETAADSARAADAGGGWRDPELENALAALDAAVHAGRHAAAVRLADAVHPLLTRSGDFVHRLRLWRAVLAAATGLGDDARRGRALCWIANSQRNLGDLNASLTAATEAVEIAERLGDRWALAQAVRDQGETLRTLSRFAPAEEALLRALRLFEEHETVEEQVETRSALATLYNVWQRTEETERILAPAFALLRDVPGETSTHAWVRLGLSHPARMRGRPDEAHAAAEEAAAIARRIGDDYVLAYCHQEFGHTARADGRYADAEREFRDMLRLLTRVGNQTGVAQAHQHLGVVARLRGRRRAARAEFDTALAIFTRLGDTTRAEACRHERDEP